jgi:flavin-dependent dehydrogenase
MTNVNTSVDVTVIGAGPAGSVASALLNKMSHRVLVLERQHFPRFSIGESLLPQCMVFLERAGMLPVVEKAGFQLKNGARFCRGDKNDSFDFSEKFSSGWGTTFQVQRARFDQILADEARKQGVEIHFGHTVTGFDSRVDGVRLEVEDETGKAYQVESRFVLDASGFGRVLPRLLELELASSLAHRSSIFTHVKDNISDPKFDRNKILIPVHPEFQDIWYWLIPFSNGRASVGVIVPDERLRGMPGDSGDRLQAFIAREATLAGLLKNAEFDTRIGVIEGYSTDVKQLFGKDFALLGNAGEFLDPVFSSGVTIALKSASLAADVLDRQLRGLQPDWEREFVRPLKQGVNTFRVFVEAWYDGRLQDIIFTADKDEAVKQMICSILAGYAWDTENPYVKNPERISILADLCRPR